jgi:hypothetical protein
VSHSPHVCHCPSATTCAWSTRSRCCVLLYRGPKRVLRLKPHQESRWAIIVLCMHRHCVLPRHFGLTKRNGGETHSNPTTHRKEQEAAVLWTSPKRIYLACLPGQSSGVGVSSATFAVSGLLLTREMCSSWNSTSFSHTLKCVRLWTACVCGGLARECKAAFHTCLHLVSPMNVYTCPHPLIMTLFFWGPP